MSNIDISRIITIEEKAMQATTARIKAVKAECRRRILTHLSMEVQSNVAQAVAMHATALLRGVAPEEASAQSGLQEADFPVAAAARTWIAQMQATAQALAADPALEEAWPALPPNVAALASRF
jgi:hypothetical protein